MNKLAISLILILSSFTAIAQKISLSGSVVDEKNQPLSGVQILLTQKSNKSILSFAISASDGNFILSKELGGVSVDSLFLEVSFMGYGKKIIDVPKDSKKLSVVMQLREIKIREVVVNPKDIIQRKDTIAYRVASFTSIEDRTIGDVIKKMPGVEVLENGAIKYQGKEISKFYIEGSDMLGGRYGLATNNISHNDVQSVEVMENHQPIKAINDIAFSDAAAMNLILKQDAKTRWAGTIKAGGGLPDLWVGELFAMRFKKRFQNISSYKTNNTGGNSFDLNSFLPISDFDFSMGGNSLTNYINVAPSIASNIGLHRSNFNKTHNLNSNNLFKLKNGFDLIAELIAKHERKESDYDAKTTYYLPDGKVEVEDKTESANSLEKSISGNIRLKANENSYYLNNNLSFSYDENHTNVGIVGTFPNMQKANYQTYKISNEFDILKRKENKFFTYRSSFGYSSLPQSLAIAHGEDIEPINQDIHLSSLHFNNSYDYSIKIGKFRVAAPINLNYNYQNIENSLNNELYDNTADALSTHKININTTPSFDYNIKSLKFDISAKIFYQPLNIGGKWHNIFGVNPRANINWTISPLFKLSSSGGYSKGVPDESTFFNGYIMSNYRNLNLGYFDVTTGHSSYVSLRAEYKDVLKSTFANINGSYSKGENRRVAAQDFEGDYIISYFIPGQQSYQTIMVYGSMGVGIDAINSTITLSPSFRKSISTILRNGAYLPYDSENYSLRLLFSSNIRHNLTLSYDGNIGLNRYRSDSETIFSNITNLTQKAKFSYAPIKKVKISYGFEHYMNELQTSNFKHFFFSDISASYLIGSRWEISCSVKNLFNEKYYSSFTESDLSSYYRSNKIRPRNILIDVTYRF